MTFMIPEVFLICALALPATNYHNDIVNDNNRRIKEVRQIHDFIKKHYPNAEIWIGPNAPEVGYEKTPILWRDIPVWIKRPPVSDRRSS